MLTRAHTLLLPRSWVLGTTPCFRTYGPVPYIGHKAVMIKEKRWTGSSPTLLRLVDFHGRGLRRCLTISYCHSGD